MDGLITRKELIERGWSSSLISRWLGKPDDNIESIPLYDSNRVSELEELDAVQIRIAETKSQRRFNDNRLKNDIPIPPEPDCEWFLNDDDLQLISQEELLN